MKRILNSLLILLLIFISIGSTIKSVEASAGGYNKSALAENLYYNNVLDESGISEGDILYGSGYNEDFSEEVLATNNIYDVGNFSTYAGYINSIGTLVSHVSYTTDLSYTEAERFTDYTFTNFSTESITRIAQYDIDFNFITSINILATEHTIFTGAYTAYFRISVIASSFDFETIQIKEGTTGGSYTDFISYDSLHTIRYETYNLQTSDIILTGADNAVNVRYGFSYILDNMYIPSIVDELILIVEGWNQGLYSNRSVIIDSFYTSTTTVSFGYITGTNLVTAQTDLEDLFIAYKALSHVDRNYSYSYINYITIDELPYLYNLTEIFGAGNEVSESTFDTLLSEMPDYFETYVFNYYEEDSNISDFGCERTVENIILNGDFNDPNPLWLVNGGTSSLFDGYMKIYETVSSPSVTYYQSTASMYSGHYYYVNLDYFSDINSHTLRVYTGSTYGFDIMASNLTIGWNNYSFIYEVHDNTVFHFGSYADLVRNWQGNLDNIFLLDLTILYGKGNEPILEEFELLIAEAPDYFETYTYDDTCYMSVEQNSPIYQYEDYADPIFDTTINLTFTETILEMDSIKPTVYLAKYDLEMNYIGDFYEGNVDSSIVNGDGYVEHTFDYTLPSTTFTEDGYIYVAYDSSEVGAKILGSGYVFAEPSTAYYSMGTGLNVISIGNYPYSTASTDYDFNSEVTEYVFNNDDPYVLHHVRVDNVSMATAEVYYYSENTTQIITIDLLDTYNNFNYLTDLYDVPQDTYEFVFYTSINGALPPLLNYLDSYDNLYINYLNGVLSDYTDYMMNMLYDNGYAVNEGIYTYGVYTDEGVTEISTGQTPLYYMDNLHSMSIVNDEIKSGKSLQIEIVKDNTLIDDVYTYNYLYDNNTGLFDYDIDDDISQTISLEVFEGLSPDNATLYYHLQNINGVYRNTALESVYDIYFYDTYSVVNAVPFDEAVDNAMAVINMDSIAGRVLVSVVIIALATILVFIKTRNIVIVIFMIFILVALLTLLGFIPLWIVLVLVMLLFGAFFIKGKSSDGGGE